MNKCDTVLTREQESELFQYLVRQPRFAQWVEQQLDVQLRVLMVNPDTTQLHRAQGASSVYSAMQDKLAAAKAELLKT